ncbi:MAG: hypothetical protein E7271_02200 [Lachnospiraceae bacterium]|jgi:hypothetical protein|nr:hypothetical protein [Lachnospiraceae bacterium]
MIPFLIAIMIAAGFMIIAYFIYFFKRTTFYRRLFSIAMLLLIALLISAWIFSIATGRHSIVLLILAIVFIILHRLS